MPLKQPKPKKPAEKKSTEAQMRSKWMEMGKDIEFKKDSTDMKNSLKDYRSVEIMYPKMKDPRELATSSASPKNPRDKHKVESGYKAMKASVTFDKVVAKRKGDKDFYDKMKLKKSVRERLE